MVHALESAFDGDDELGDSIVGILSIDDGEVDLANGGGDVRLGGRTGGEAGIGHGFCMFVVGGMFNYGSISSLSSAVDDTRVAGRK